MIDPQLLEYIRKQKALGVSATSIEGDLIAKNYSSDSIAEHMAAAAMPPAVPPVATTPLPPQAPPQNIVAAPVENTPPLPVPPASPVMPPIPPVPPQPIAPASPAPPVVNESRIPAAPAKTNPDSLRIMPAAVPTTRRRSDALLISFILILIFLVCGAIGFWYWWNASGSSMGLFGALQPAPTPNSQAIVPASAQPATSTSVADFSSTSTASTTSVFEPSNMNTFSFTPSTSTIPAFSFQYPNSFSAPQMTESDTGVAVSLGSSTSATLGLDFSVFPNPLDASQTPLSYLSSIFPTATITDISTNGTFMFKVASPSFSKGQSDYFIFLNSTNVVGIIATASGASKTQPGFASSTQDAILRSLTFTE